MQPSSSLARVFYLLFSIFVFFVGIFSFIGGIDYLVNKNKSTKEIVSALSSNAAFCGYKISPSIQTDVSNGIVRSAGLFLVLGLYSFFVAFLFFKMKKIGFICFLFLLFFLVCFNSIEELLNPYPSRVSNMAYQLCVGYKE